MKLEAEVGPIKLRFHTNYIIRAIKYSSIFGSITTPCCFNARNSILVSQHALDDTFDSVLPQDGLWLHASVDTIYATCG
jgi:hypothetical protein